jgi:hypothetical protein
VTVRRIWWVHPGKLILYFIVPIYLFIVYVVPRVWPQVIVLKGGCFIQGSFAAIGLVLLALHGICGLLGARIVLGRVAGGAWIKPLFLGAIGFVTIAAYVIWFFPVLLHGRVDLERSELNAAPGITSFSQAGVPFVVCYLYCKIVGGQVFPRLIRYEFGVILVLTVARVFLWGERLAAIELFVPAAILILVHGRLRPFQSLMRPAIETGGPYLAIPGLLVSFTITEYFRSWRTYSHTQSVPLVDFMTARVVQYYYTALNNGAGLLATRSDEWPTFQMLHTLNWLYRLPLGVGDALYVAFIGYGQTPTSIFLSTYADPEFNNMSGIFPIIYDLGTAGAIFYFCAFGTVAGLLYRDMLRGRKLGTMLYPTVFVGCLEILRVGYLNGSRVTILLLAAFFLCWNIEERSSGGEPGERTEATVSPDDKAGS